MPIFGATTLNTMHTIRLRGPWQIAALSRSELIGGNNTATEPGELPAATETAVPNDWGEALGSDFRGRARYTRRFGLPTNLSPEERVSIVIALVDWRATVVLNGEMLGRQTLSDGERKYEITRLLKTRNELQIVVELPRVADSGNSLVRPGREHLPGGLIGEVRLEIDGALPAIS